MEYKTNVMRIIEQHKGRYEAHAYDAASALSGTEVAAVLHQNPAQVFKTLVTVGKSKKNYVFMVPVAAELDLKKAASAVGEKSVEMLKSKELLPLTGYIHGGCSPVGMKKHFRTFIDESARDKEKIFVSAGKKGVQMQLNPEDLARFTGARFMPLAEHGVTPE